MDDAQHEVPDTKIPQLDVVKAWKEAKLLKQDLDNGEGWTQRLHVPNEYNSWSKTCPDDDVPVKVIHRFENMPMSAEKFIEMMSPEKMELRMKWDKSEVIEILEKLPNKGCIGRTVVDLPFPLSNRDFVVYFSPPYETDDWFGKKAFATFQRNATHPSRPAGVDGIVRASNGGNFTITVPDDEEPENKSEMWMLTTNNYNGWVSSEFVIGRRAPKVFYPLRKSILEGYKEYFSN